jgi:splicing factor U2AF 65 kDa subunit
MDVGGKKLKMAKACIGPAQVANFDVGIAAISGLASQTGNEAEQSRVLQLLNMVTAEELMDPDEYEGASRVLINIIETHTNSVSEICDDVREECSKFGSVAELKVPRPVGGSRQSAGVGKIFVKFDTPESTTQALRALAGRKFADRTVVATYFPEVWMPVALSSNTAELI